MWGGHVSVLQEPLRHISQAGRIRQLGRLLDIILTFQIEQTGSNVDSMSSSSNKHCEMGALATRSAAILLDHNTVFGIRPSRPESFGERLVSRDSDAEHSTVRRREAEICPQGGEMPNTYRLTTHVSGFRRTNT